MTEDEEPVPETTFEELFVMGQMRYLVGKHMHKSDSHSYTKMPPPHAHAIENLGKALASGSLPKEAYCARLERV